MSKVLNLRQHENDSWIMGFECFAANGVPMNLFAGSFVQFKISAPDGTGLTISSADIGNAVVISDPVNGTGSISITPAMQAAAGLTARKSYKYELKVTTPDISSVQAEGRFTILPSLFATT
jgi:hypothetical protein